ncbi:hypothetical protein [Mogibacterium sp.]|uniref:hypothetical protein n=1 Tax=Mogibacterium sp. TaxID=2049035 RepID=UPI00257C0E40|nr:hypothetical protein [Mogibacterium sp.]MBN2935947.1 sigma-70 family RNA polymerase sigma factor [Mogibacterium sp.]
MTEYAQIADARLRKLGEAEWEIKTCMQRIEELENVAQCCGSLNITDKVQNSVTGNKMEEAVVELLEEQERLKTLAGEWIELKKSILSELDTLPPLYRDLLLRRYCDREKCEDTANELHYSESHLRLLRRKALEQLGENIKNNN